MKTKFYLINKTQKSALSAHKTESAAKRALQREASAHRKLAGNVYFRGEILEGTVKNLVCRLEELIKHDR
jgi:uncharacterized protein (UPF0333 family)